jgi:peptidoglycan-N-acetylglucosamine deacetylase
MLVPFVALTAAAAASYAGYATMAPESQLYGRTITHGSDPAQMALTFDDGPNDPCTLRLIDLLDRFQAKATFFLIGKYVRQRPDIVRAIQAAGHAIGNHTENHPNLIFLPAKRLRDELESCTRALEDALGQGVRWFRPPFGGRRPAVLGMARLFEMEPVMWSVTGFDWNAKSSAAIFERVTAQVDRRGKAQSEIILLHDGGHLAFGTDRQFTIEATQRLLERYSPSKKFVSLEDLTLQ